MGKRLIISEDEKKNIKKLYNLNEGIYDDAIEYLKDKGEDIIDYFKDVLDIDTDKDEEDEELTISDIEDRISDDDLSKDEIEKLEKKLKNSEYSVSEDDLKENKILPSELFKMVKSRVKNEEIAFALVANAWGESGFDCSIKGDGGKYAQEKKESIMVGNKKYCSFGLWQFNICGGLGISYLKEYGYQNKTPKEKLELLSDCYKQIEFMCKHMNKKTQEIKTKKSVLDWVEWIVRNVERPSDLIGATKKRQEWAKKNIDNVDYNISDETLKNLV